MTINFKKAKTISHNKLTEKLHYCVFEEEEPMTFIAGQYISVKVAENRINAYSIACRESENRFGLLVDTSPGGPGSRFFESLKVDNIIEYLGPFGIFTFKPNDGAQRILFFATGSGCAPIRAIIDDLLLNKYFSKPMTLYLGVRFVKDIFWSDYFEKLTKEHANFVFKLVLSKPDETWNGLTGHITDYILKDYPDAKDCSAYLCGNPPMIKEAKSLLLQVGCPQERIYYESFF